MELAEAVPIERTSLPSLNLHVVFTSRCRHDDEKFTTDE